MIEKLEWVDKELLLLVNGDYPIWLDDLMFLISEKTTWIPFYVLCLFFLWKALGTKAWALSLLFIAGMLALSDWGSVHLFKNVFQRFRPCHNLEIKGLVYLVDNHCGGKYGFVSSHAANHFAIATFLAGTVSLRWRWTRYLFVFWACVVAISRVYLGVHYPSDIFVGGLYGLIIGLVFSSLLGRLVLRRNLKP